MASIQTRNSVVAIVKETTEGTLKKPSASSEYIAIQADFSMSPNTNTLASDELKASIGQPKAIQGAEAPQASFSHYLRASGVEGQAPSYGPLLEAALGAVSVAGTEYNTDTGSTVSILKVASPNGSTFERGEAALIKDGTNGYRIRAFDSVTATDLNMGFNLPAGTAPASGVGLGKCVVYKPANADHPTLSIWHYLGQKGAIQAMAGGRVTSTSISISAGELINAQYNLEGVGYYYDPIEVVTGANDIVFDIGAGNVTASVPLGMYKSPHDLAAAVKAAISSAAAGTYTFTYSDLTGKFTLTKSAGTLDVDWLTGTDSIGATLGFTADDTGALSYVSDVAQNYASPQNPAFDAADPLAAKDNECMIGLAADQACFKASTVNISVNTPKADILSVCEASGIAGSVIQSREVVISVSALLEQYDAGEYEKYRTGQEIKFQYSLGQKSGGNWIPGKCGYIYVPTASILAFNVEDNNGLAQLTMEIRAHVNSNGDGEFYLGFL